MYTMRAVLFRLRSYSTLEAGPENAYKILGLRRNCSVESVRAAFRELAKATHPDKQQPGLSGSASSAHFVRVLAAYQILADPRKRALYDAQLVAQEARQERREEFYQNHRRKEYASKRRSRGFDRGVDSSDADPSASIHEPERQEFVCPESHVVEWLRQYRSAVTSAVHRRELGVGGGLMEGVRGELGSALRKAYHGPPVYEEKGIPDCFEADERAEPHVGSDILQLVSGHNLFGFVRVPQHPMLESLQSHTKAIDRATGYARECSYADSSNHYNLGHTGHSSSMDCTGNEAVESEYVDLELHVFGNVIARASRVQPKVGGSSPTKSRDCIYVYSALPGSEEKQQNSKSGSELIGTIRGLGDVNPQIVTAVHGPDGQLTHRIVQHQSPLVKHMTWFKESGSCECRCRRASLLPSRYWIFAPRSATHNVGGWYIETWSSDVRHRKHHSVQTGDEYGVVETSTSNSQRINPAMYIIAAAYKTLDEEAAKRHKISKYIELSTMFLFARVTNLAIQLQGLFRYRGWLPAGDSISGGEPKGFLRCIAMSEYWTVSQGRANHTGHSCRECRGTIFTNEPIYVRDGRKIRLFYHRKCYSGDADPRTQARSSYSHNFWGIGEKAPRHKGRGRWWTSEFGYRGRLDAAPPTLRNLASPLPSEALRRPTSILQRRSSPSSACPHQTSALVDVHSNMSETMFEQTFLRRKACNSRPAVTWP